MLAGARSGVAPSDDMNGTMDRLCRPQPTFRHVMTPLVEVGGSILASLCVGSATEAEARPCYGAERRGAHLGSIYHTKADQGCLQLSAEGGGGPMSSSPGSRLLERTTSQSRGATRKRLG